MGTQKLWGFEITVPAWTYNLLVFQSKWPIIIPYTIDYQACFNYERLWLIKLLKL